VAITIWAFATAGQYDEELFDAAGAFTSRHIRAYYQQELSNIAWAYAESSHQHMGMMTAIAEEVVSKVGLCWVGRPGQGRGGEGH
jgi:hypothetical protein